MTSVREPRGSEHEQESSPASPDTEPADDLLALAISQPALALTTAHRLLANRPGARARSYAHHAIAIVERDRGRVDAAVVHGRAAVRAGTAVDERREAEARATLGTTLLFAGRTRLAMHHLDRALALTPRAGRHRVLHLHGTALWLLGRYEMALSDLTEAVALSRRAGDALWEGRALGNRADIRRALGDQPGAERDYRASETVLLAIGEDLEATLSSHNRAVVAFEQGDIVAALRLMQQAQERFDEFGVHSVEHTVDHLHMLLTAQLAAEARQTAAALLGRADLAPVWRADVLMASARAHLIDDDRLGARRQAEEAELLFHRHRRSRWAQRAALLALESRYADLVDRMPPGRPTTDRTEDVDDLLSAARRVVARLRALDDPALPEALLLLAQVAGTAGAGRISRRALLEASERRRTGTPLARAAGWLAAALLARQRGDRRALLHACRRGLAAVDEHRDVIGDLELRALATGYGYELAVLALADMAAQRDARGLVWWAERWRGTALVGPTNRPPDDPELRTEAAALRDVTRRLGGSPDEPLLLRERARLEAALRNRYRHLSAGGSVDALPVNGSLLDRFGDTVLAYLVVVGADLHLVTLVEGRVAYRVVGPLENARREADYARFALRRAAYGRLAPLGRPGSTLERAVFGEQGLPGDGDVVVVPPAGLLTVPFGLMPSLRGRAVSVAPSLALWRRATQPPSTAVAGRQRVTLVAGPRLSAAQQEIVALAGTHEEATVLSGTAATVAAAVAALDGARLGHVAAHGTFRADAPLFSSLEMVDGPLMIHDIDRMARPPTLLVLSACDTGGVRPIGADEALGLVSGLLALGVRGVVASVVPINDDAAVPVMTHTHDAVGRGGSLAEGLRRARMMSEPDSVTAATAAAFTAWGG